MDSMIYGHKLFMMIANSNTRTVANIIQIPESTNALGSLVPASSDSLLVNRTLMKSP